MMRGLRQALSKLLSLDAWEARLVVRRAGRYAIAIRSRGEAVTRVELGTDDAGAAFSADPDERERLQGAGFARAAGPSGKVWELRRPDDDPPDPDDAAGLVQHVVDGLELLGAEAGAMTFEITVDAEPPPDNPRLVEAMRATARAADVPSRQALYAALANGQLVVPIDPATLTGPADAHAPLTVGEFEGGPVLAVFSDVHSLRRWRHAGHPWAGVHGVDFFGHAERVGATTVRVNPDGAVGGELYQNEVSAIVEGIRRFQASTMN